MSPKGAGAAVRQEAAARSALLVGEDLAVYGSLRHSPAQEWTQSKPHPSTADLFAAAARLYWGANFTGAYACMTPGSTWAQSSSGPRITFDHGSGQSGYGQSVWNNIASVQWTSTPC